MDFNIKILIEAQNSSEAAEITSSLITIYKNLSTSDLKTIAKHIENDPSVIHKVKKIAGNPLVQKLFGKKL